MIKVSDSGDLQKPFYFSGFTPKAFPLIIISWVTVYIRPHCLTESRYPSIMLSLFTFFGMHTTAHLSLPLMLSAFDLLLLPFFRMCLKGNVQFHEAEYPSHS